MNPDKAFARCHRSRTLASPVVVSVPHAGLRIPESRKDLMMIAENVFYRDVDFEIHRMWDDACEARDLSFIKSEVHRYAIDLNRREDQIDSPKGLIWTESTRGEPLGPHGRPFVGLELGVREKLIELVWRPYYAFILEELSRAREKFGYAILIDGHSMPSKGTSFHADPGFKRADIVPGDNKGLSCAPVLMETVSSAAAKAGFEVSPNKPYSGGNITQRFGRPSEGFHSIQIEVNRAIYVQDEESSRKSLAPQGLARLKGLAEEILERLKLPAKDLFSL